MEHGGHLAPDSYSFIANIAGDDAGFEALSEQDRTTSDQCVTADIPDASDMVYRQIIEDSKGGHWPDLELDFAGSDHCSMTRSEEHTPEIQSLLRISSAVSCLTNIQKTSH